MAHAGGLIALMEHWVQVERYVEHGHGDGPPVLSRVQRGPQSDETQQQPACVPAFIGDAARDVFRACPSIADDPVRRIQPSKAPVDRVTIWSDRTEPSKPERRIKAAAFE